MGSGDALMLSVSGCRGVMGTSLTPGVAARFAAAFAGFVRGRRAKNAKGNPTIVLGRDGRRGSDLFASVARATLLADGCDVWDLDIAMTPTVGRTVDHRGADGGLVITASHNPQEWCGLKPIVRTPGERAGVVDASAPSKADADSLIKNFNATREDDVRCAKSWQGLGKTLADKDDAGTNHLTKVIAALGSSAHEKLQDVNPRVVLDHLSMSGGAAGEFALLELVGYGDDAVYELYKESTWTKLEDRGLFPHAPEPLAANLTALCKEVKKRKAAVGFAQDPDGDRLAIVDEKGRYIGEEYTLVLCTMALAELGKLPKKSTLVVNLSTSRMIEDVAAKFGCKVARAAVGEANVVEMMKRLKSPLGGEGNGGVIWPKVTYIRDSLGAMGLVLALMAKTGKRVSELVERVPKYAIVKRKVDLAKKEDARPGLEKLAKHYASKRVDRQDGVRVDFDDPAAWVHVRASNTEPIMRLIAEAPTQKAAEVLLAEVEGVIAS